MAVVLIVSMLVSFWVGEPGTVVPQEAFAKAYEIVNNVGNQAAEFFDELM